MEAEKQPAQDAITTSAAAAEPTPVAAAELTLAPATPEPEPVVLEFKPEMESP